MGRVFLFSVLCLILLVLAAPLVVLYEGGFLTDSTEPEPTELEKIGSTGILWQRSIKNFATG